MEIEAKERKLLFMERLGKIHRGRIACQEGPRCERSCDVL